MTNEERMETARVDMTQDAYFEASEGRNVVTPENLSGLLEYPALFNAMRSDRELRPALSPAMSTGRALNDFLTCTAEEFGARYTVADGPVNPKTGRPYGPETKSYLDWASKQDKTPVTSDDFRMFSEMAKAYDGHVVIGNLSAYACHHNAVYAATVEGVDCLVKIDKLYVSPDAVVAVDIKTTSDIGAFGHTASSLRYREQQALIALVLETNGIQNPQVFIAAIEKGPLPRCGVFGVGGLDEIKTALRNDLHAYGESLVTGGFGTRYESLRML